MNITEALILIDEMQAYICGCEPVPAEVKARIAEAMRILHRVNPPKDREFLAKLPDGWTQCKWDSGVNEFSTMYSSDVGELIEDWVELPG